VPKQEPLLGSTVVRDARPADAAACAELLGQLGYPTDTSTVRGRIDRFAGDPVSRMFVAEAGGRVVGLAAVSALPLVERDGRWARLSAIVVDEDARGRGVGRALVDAVEAEAAARGCGYVEVTTADRRAHAHAFYRRLGYERVSRRFLKTLPGFPPKRP
jgi:GNAT superfamily N-acetyltransferase